MRLLEYVDGRLTLTKDLPPQEVPLYAILSHTWGRDSDEVTYKDLVEGTGEDKPGYQKVKFCAEQTARDGLRYFWIDTCCIDKSDSSELSKSINSMFNWYKNSERCFVYLSDVSNIGYGYGDSRTFEFARNSALQRSRWFSRGWTLQELVAPASVEFFTKQGQRLGDKRSLEQAVHQITGIPVSILRGGSVYEYDIEDRFKWAENRHTTYEEDSAYCLLGIFGVFMPPIYGEGRIHALRRLRKEIADVASRVPVHKLQETKTRFWMVPFERNLSFTGRETELEDLRRALFKGRQTPRVAVTGLGGIGKSQLALELIYRIIAGNKECSVIWIPSTTNGSLERAYLDTARQLGIPGCDDDSADVKRMVQNYLSSEKAGQWLLVFDNADDIRMWVDRPTSGSYRLIDYLPKSNRGSIIFTTRDKKAAMTLAGRDSLEIFEMSLADSNQLLRNYIIDQGNLSEEDGQVEALLDRLACHPLAIFQAAMYINQNCISLRDYASLLEEDMVDLLSDDFDFDSRYHDVRSPVAATWHITFEQICQHNPLAMDYLSTLACVEATDIPRTILPPSQSRKSETEAMGVLQRYSFNSQITHSTISIHRLVHLATRHWLRKKSTLDTWTDSVVERLVYVLEESDIRNIEKELGLLKEAKVLETKVMNTMKTKLGEEHYDTLDSMGNLATSVSRQGRYEEAKALELKVLTLRKRLLGLEHEDTLSSMANLALVYKGQQRWDKAEALNVETLEMMKGTLGVEQTIKYGQFG